MCRKKTIQNSQFRKPMCTLPYLDPPPINNGNGCNGKHCNGKEDGANDDGQEVIVSDGEPGPHDGIGGEVVE